MDLINNLSLGFENLKLWQNTLRIHKRCMGNVGCRNIAQYGQYSTDARQLCWLIARLTGCFWLWRNHCQPGKD